MTVDPNEVHKAMINCLAPDMSVEGMLTVEGIMGRYGFDPAKLEIYRPLVTEWLNEMDPNFHRHTEESGGGGWSFLNFCQDRHGTLWTGMHQTCEELIVLGIGLGMVKWCLPRGMWDALPGGMPYLVIDTTR